MEFVADEPTWVRVLGKLSSGIQLTVKGIDADKLEFGQGASAAAVDWE